MASRWQDPRAARGGNTVGRPTVQSLNRHRSGKSRTGKVIAGLRVEVTPAIAPMVAKRASNHGDQPWNGCSASAWMGSSTCKNGRNYKSYVECRKPKFLRLETHWKSGGIAQQPARRGQALPGRSSPGRRAQAITDAVVHTGADTMPRKLTSDGQPSRSGRAIVRR